MSTHTQYIYMFDVKLVALRAKNSNSTDVEIRELYCSSINTKVIGLFSKAI